MTMDSVLRDLAQAAICVEWAIEQGPGPDEELCGDCLDCNLRGAKVAIHRARVALDTQRRTAREET